ncbi:MAG: serine/threonine-protein kinase [Rhodothermales bacterium]
MPLTPAQWLRIQETFETLLALPPDRRRDALNALSDDPDVRAEVDALLEVSDAPDPVEANRHGRWRRAIETAYAERALEKVGPYRLLRRLGAGGMGVVYLAERDDPDLAQRVALKLVRVDLPEAIQLRFLQERHILAGLSHPNIAHLLDGGLTPDGSPYFAMEYVDGQPIDAFCDTRRLPIEARIKLFMQVCDAVQHAHNNLVVHRDLKPSNILVTDAGTVKLLDFGIARLLDASSPAGEPTTLGFLTPRYASPEQIKRERLSTASDVYTLGVVLYELLTGSLPYRGDIRSAGGLERAICDEEPDKPSTRWRTADETQTRRATDRSSAPDRLARRLQGDLDIILLKALHKQPRRRYAAVDQFQADLKRFLLDLPIQARPDSALYKTRKFIRRHRWASAALALFVLVVTGDHARLSAAWTRAESALAVANAERLKAETISGTLTSMFSEANPGLGATDTLYAARLLQNGERHVRGLADQPDVQIALIRTMSKAYCNLGYHDRARKLAVDASRKSVALFGSDSPTYAQTLTELGVIERVTGHYREADSLFARAHPILRETLGETSGTYLELLNSRAGVLLSLDRLEESKALMDRALFLADSASLTDYLPEAHSNLGAYYFKRMDFASAAAHHRTSLRILETLGKEDLPEYASQLVSLAITLEADGQAGEALRLKMQALAMRERVLPADHLSITTNLHQIGLTYRRLEDYDLAIAYHTRVLERLDHIHAGDHRLAAAAMASMAMIFDTIGDTLRAERLHLDAIAMQQRIDGDASPTLVSLYANLGAYYAQHDDLNDAAAWTRRALAGSLTLLGDRHHATLAIREDLALIEARRGRCAAADSLLDALPASMTDAGSASLARDRCARLAARQ